MSDPYIAQIYLVGYNFAQKNFAFCAGQLYPIAQNNALFALIGTTFGGNGVQTFGLPDLQGRVPVGLSQQGGNYVWGAVGGTETNTLNQLQLPPHDHPASLLSVADLANTEEPGNAALAISSGGQIYNNQVTPTTPMTGLSVGIAGQGQPVNNMPPYLVLNYEIALFGIFPTRD